MILQRLREETRLNHERLENHIDLLGRPWSMPFYQTLLGKFYGFYAAIEPGIFAHPEWAELGIDVAQRTKTGLLKEDLAFLGLSGAEIEALPLCDTMPDTSSMASAFGCAYVLEGASLGGQIISRHLKRELDVEPGQGCSFFSSYGENVGPMWKQFTGVMNAYELNDNEADTLVSSASATFRNFENWLSDIL